MAATKTKTWHPTKHEHLYRHKSGIYYVRLGKRTWRSLRTKLLSVAIKERDKMIEAERARVEMAPESVRIENFSMTEMKFLRMAQIKRDVSLKESTKEFWRQIYACLFNSWPGLAGRDVRKISAEQCITWAEKFSKNVSPSHFNNTVIALTRLFDTAIDAGLRHTNPAGKIKKRPPVNRDLSLELPSTEKFAEWVAEIRRGRSRWADGCGDLVEFLSYSGLRIGEAKWLEWRHCNFDKQILLVTGDPETGTKNRQSRYVPMIPALVKLLLQIKDKSQSTAPTGKVLAVHSARDAMKRAAAEVGMKPVGHHDLRHLFATVCIESGTDIPTVARWLGHKDGGALAMKIYGHLRDEHSVEMAKKISFSA